MIFSSSVRSLAASASREDEDFASTLGTFDTGAAFDAADIGNNQIQNFEAIDSLVLDMTVFSQLTSAVGSPLSANEFAVVNSADEAALSDAFRVP